MKKSEAITILVACAKAYHDNLANQNVLFLFGTVEEPDFLETTFLTRHFAHLTGVVLEPKRVKSSTDFYDRCRKSRVSPKDFDLAANGTTEMKLMVLPQLMQIHRTAKMIGEFDGSKSVLYTEKLAGNVSACMGFIRDDCFYIPNTALREDIRDITLPPQKRVLAIFRKSIRDGLYTELCYKAKGVAVESIRLPEALQGRLQI